MPLRFPPPRRIRCSCAGSHGLRGAGGYFHGLGLPELAGDAAVLVNPYDVSDIASGLESAVADGALRNRLIEHGLKRVKLFTPEEAARRTCQTYERVLHE